MTTQNRIKKSQNLKRLFNTFIIVTMLFVFHFNVKAQSPSPQDEVLIVADEMPSYPGGNKALMDMVYKNITYPDDAKDKGIEGKVIVRFIVDKDGNVKQPSISKGLWPSIDYTVLLAISKISKFTPGKMAGKPVSVWYALPVTFKVSK
jgi:TonB family protein